MNDQRLQTPDSRPQTSNYVGQRVKRTEDPRLIKGLAHYVDDIRLPDTLHVAFVRSVYAHARITNIDTSEALKSPGVVAVYTGQDVAKIGPVPCAGALPGLKVPDYRVLAQRSEERRVGKECRL